MQLRRMHQKQWVRSKIVDSLIVLTKYLFLFLIGGLYGMLSCIVFILTLFITSNHNREVAKK